jgi:uroporphyrinogen-III synthase
VLLGREDAALAARIAALGAEVVAVSLGELTLDTTAPQRVREALPAADVLLWTSANAVRAVGPPPGPQPARVVAVGQATAQAARDAGWRVDLVPASSTGADAARALGALDGLSVLWPGAAEVEAGTLAALAAARLTRLVVYDNAAPAGLAARLAALPPVTLAALLAPSGARRLAAAWPDRPLPPAVTIGPSTSRAAREAGLHVLAEASPHDTAGLVAAIGRALAS